VSAPKEGETNGHQTLKHCRPKNENGAQTAGKRGTTHRKKKPVGTKRTPAKFVGEKKDSKKKRGGKKKEGFHTRGRLWG